MQDRREFIHTVGRYAAGGVVAASGLDSFTWATTRVQIPSVQPPGITPPPLQKVANNLYVIWGSDANFDKTWTGGSTMLFITERNGVVMIDGKNPGWGQHTVNLVKSITDKPITTVIVTHTHYDHTASLVEMPHTFETITQVNCAKAMAKKECNHVTGCEYFQGDNAKYLPKRTFTDRMTLFSGADRVELYSFGRSHTDGDTVIHIPSLRTVHPGDIYPGKYSPNLDLSNAASGVGYPKVLAAIGKAFKNIDVVVPAHHDALQKWSDMMEYRDWQQQWIEYVRKGMEAGKTPEQIADSYVLPERFKGYGLNTVKAPKRLRVNTGIICEELKGSAGA
jgi:cyclase